MSRAAIQFSKTTAHRASHKILCAPAQTGGLTPEHLIALHAFKHEILAAAYRLYKEVPPHLADPILETYFIVAPDKMDPDAPPPPGGQGA